MLIKRMMCFATGCQKYWPQRHTSMLYQTSLIRYFPTYSESFIEPTNPHELLEEDIHPTDPRRFQPVKAVANNVSMSMLYDFQIERFVNIFQTDGEREKFRNIVHKAFMEVKLIQIAKYNEAQTDAERERIEINPRTIFFQAIENCSPLLRTMEMERAGTMYTVPVTISSKRASWQAMKWLIESCGEKERGIPAYHTLAMELINASQNEGKSIRKKQELHRLCEQNRAYANFRW